LLSGNHAAIAAWRAAQARERTGQRRPDLLINENEKMKTGETK
jgi:tRNA (guanine-N1)-methyltransferase